MFLCPGMRFMDSGRKLDPGGVERGDITDVEKKGILN